MSSIAAAAFVVLPFLVVGLITIALPAPVVWRGAHLVASSGLCLLVVALLTHAGILLPAS